MKRQAPQDRIAFERFGLGPVVDVPRWARETVERAHRDEQPLATLLPEQLVLPFTREAE